MQISREFHCGKIISREEKRKERKKKLNRDLLHKLLFHLQYLHATKYREYIDSMFTQQCYVSFYVHADLLQFTGCDHTVKRSYWPENANNCLP